MSADASPRLRFPRIVEIALNGFSLYTQERNVNLRISKGVLCLAGANGIGKSTFLSAVNYATTGRIPGSGRRYDSAGEYFVETSLFSRTFFDGRIDEPDRATAYIEVQMDIGDLRFILARSLFAPDSLLRFETARIHDGANRVEYDGETATDDERQRQYAVRLSEAMGLSSFEQFVFLQHFVLTFDESRHLLFWDEKALEAALFIAFGTDPNKHASADHHRREAERADSLGRNLKWQSLQYQKRANALLSALGSATDDGIKDLEADYQKLEEERDTAATQAEQSQSTVSDVDLELAGVSAELVGARQEYGRVFAQYVGEHSTVHEHPIVTEAATEQHCVICGTSGEQVAKRVVARIEEGICPLCGSPIGSETADTNAIEQLQNLDRQIADARKRMEVVSAKRDRLIMEHGKAVQEAERTSRIFQEFEQDHEDFVSRLAANRYGTTESARQELKRLQNEAKSLLKKSREHYANRDLHKRQLQELQREIESHYKAAEEEFVPRFRGLAERFLGIDLDVVVELRPSGLALVLELRNTRRREEHQLSESQRFFLDIALRMALAQFVSDPESPAAMFIDTPEGSLDIAYEARAGEMFARFVDAGHDIVMTANINTSQLLRKLAAACGSNRMQLVRMTEWAELSDVQQEEEALFRDAYKAIEEELAAGGGT